MARRVKAILLAAGPGTRLRPLTDSVPKCLVPIGGRPLLDYWMDRLSEAGIRDARINTHALADRVRDYIERTNRVSALRLTESYEPELLGSAGTIAANASFADDADEIVIIYADNLSDVDLGRMLEFHRAHGDPFTMLLFRASDPKACGIAELDTEGRILSFVEKPRDPRSDLANAGVYVVSATAYREIAALGAFDLAFDVLPRFVGRMRGWPWPGYHRDIGTLEALERARAEFPSFRANGCTSGHSGRRPAVFLDRDGTLIEHVHYLSDPADVRLLPGAAEALRRLRQAGFACVVISNQSAVGRGMITDERVEEIHDELRRQLADQDTGLDGIYYCPVVPGIEDRTVVEHADRKPGPGLLIRAAEELSLDLGSSWMVGDLISDVLAGDNAGCRGSILVGTGKGLAGNEALACSNFETCDDVLAAAEMILSQPLRSGRS
jgi:D,D-heptose 1,7-bisphosphate phosphatase